MKTSVLIIDDDSRNIFALAAVLSVKGFRVLSATDMQQAFHTLQQRPNVGNILIDMMMPGMDGYQAIPLLKNMPETGQIPILAVTAQAMPGDRQRCLNAGADDYIAKPVDVDLLLNMINAQLK